MAFTFSSIEDAQRQWGEDKAIFEQTGVQTEKQKAAHAYVAEQKSALGTGEVYDSVSGSWSKPKTSSSSSNKPKYTDNTANIKADQEAEFGAIERMLNERARYYTEAQEAVLAQQKEAAITALRNSYNRSVKEGKLSVQEANNQFEAQKKIIEQEYYKQAEKTALFGQEAGIQNSNQILALQSGDWRATQSNINQNITTRDQRINAIKDRLNMLREERDANISLAKQGYFNGMKEATATANMATTEALAGLRTADYNAYRDIGLAKDAAAYNASLQGDLMAYQQDLDLDKLVVGHKYDLEKLAIGHGYDLENMSVENQYKLAQMAAQAATDERLARISAASRSAGTSGTSSSEEAKTFKAIYGWDYYNPGVNDAPNAPKEYQAATAAAAPIEYYIRQGIADEEMNKLRKQLELEGNARQKTSLFGVPIKTNN